MCPRVWQGVDKARTSSSLVLKYTVHKEKHSGECEGVGNCTNADTENAVAHTVDESPVLVNGLAGFTSIDSSGKTARGGGDSKRQLVPQT
jgi:hypothetical protein